MHKPNKLKLLGVAAVLVALLAATGGLVVSLAAGGQPEVKALSYDDRVRFMVEGEKVSILRAEVFNLAGKRLFDPGLFTGRA
ncbi:MAG: hypothetical protein GWN86_31215 [Desulfobacterales bacterium]|nr:hypothetical protein [Desulfobacterales bacterium]